VAIHSVLLPTGQVLQWDLTNSQQVWDPVSGTFTDVTGTTTNLFCTGQTALADGRILVDGGHINYDFGTTDANVFDPTTSRWSLEASMQYPRWYPTVITLGDGRVLAVAGHTTCKTCVAAIPEVYDPATNTWTQLPGAQSVTPTQYPHLFVLPDGRVLETSSFAEVIPTRVLDVAAQTWTTVDPTPLDGGSAVMYEPGKVMKVGGSWDDGVGNPATTTYVLDMTQLTPSWQQTSWMAFPRVTHNLTLLADGTVLVTGGSSNANVSDPASAVYSAELWSPATHTWTTMAPMVVPRVYHSTALLLPDGRVLEAGSGRFGGTGPGVDQLSAEIYSPPYLFNGPRPTITSAPTAVSYGATFAVVTPDAARIGTVSLVRFGSVTHHFNTGQRFVKLAFQQVTGGLSVTAPTNGNVAPPGYYMLFILDTHGVPSVAAIVQMTSGVTLSSNFDDPPENPLSEGGAWASMGSNSDLMAARKAGGVATAQSLDNHGGAWHTTPVADAQFAEVTIGHQHFDGDAGPAVRVQTSGPAKDSHYLLFTNASGGNGIFRIDATGTGHNPILLVPWNVSVPVGDGDVLRLEVRNVNGIPHLKAFKNGTLIVEADDNHPNPYLSGHVGLLMWGGLVTTQLSDASATSWRGGSLGN
jgi:hypothetical protein